MVGGWSLMVGSEVERQPSCACTIFRDAGIEDELVVSTQVDPTTGTAQRTSGVFCTSHMQSPFGISLDLADPILPTPVVS